MKKEIQAHIEELHKRADAILNLARAIRAFQKECAHRALLHDLGLPIPARGGR